jgi:hypothetical protein
MGKHPKIIKEVKVNDQQLGILLDYKKEMFSKQHEAHSDIFPALVDGMRQVRELTQNIALIAGAVASFTIPVVNTSFIQTKILAYLAIILLFITISYAVYHLSEVITNEINQLAKQHNTFITLFNESIDRINTVIESGEIEKINEFDKDSVLARLDELNLPAKPDKSLNYLRSLLVLALFLLVLSFVSPDIYSIIWSYMREVFQLVFNHLKCVAQCT